MRWQRAALLLAKMHVHSVLPTIVSFGAAITAFQKGSQWQMALLLLPEIAASKLEPNVISYTAAISACEEGSQWQAGLGLLRDMQLARRTPNAYSYSAAISACAKDAEWQAGLSLLVLMLAQQAPSLFCFCAAISACEKSSEWQIALELFWQIPKFRLAPNEVSFSAVISACEKSLEWERALELLSAMPELHCVPDIISFNALISACENSGKWQIALVLLAKMSASNLSADVISFSAVISACGQGSQWQQAIELLAIMPRMKIEPNEISFNAAIGAMASGALASCETRASLRGCGTRCCHRHSFRCVGTLRKGVLSQLREQRLVQEDDRDMTVEECLRHQDLDALAADVWLMSPPCQPFTRSGKRKDHEDDRMHHPPRRILLENVIGFERSECRRRLVQALATLGWELTEFALDAEDFGLPNRRPRYYGLFRSPIRLGGFPAWGSEDEEPVLCGKPWPLQWPVPLGHFLQDAKGLAKEESSMACSLEVDPEVMRTRQRKDQRYDIHLRTDTTSACLTKANGRLPYGHSPLALVNEEDASTLEQRPKLSNQGYGPGAATDHVWREGVQVRYLSPVEQLRLMGFPEDYAFPPSLSFKDRCSLIGNSLNVKIVGNLLPLLLNPSEEKAAGGAEMCEEAAAAAADRAADLVAKAWGPRERKPPKCPSLGVMGNCLPQSLPLRDSIRSTILTDHKPAKLELLSIRDWDAVVDVVAKAMSGTETSAADPLFDYVLGPSLADKSDPRRMDFLRFLATGILEEDWRYCPSSLGIIGLVEGRLGACCVVRRYEHGYTTEPRSWGERLHAKLLPFWSLLRCNRTMPEQGILDQQGFLHRTYGPEGVDTQLRLRRKKYAAVPHLCVSLMMVDPAFQGMGLCGQTMRAVCRAADQQRLPCYLETGGRKNAAVYERFGFKVAEQFGCTTDGHGSFDEIYAMTRAMPQGGFCPLARQSFNAPIFLSGLQKSRPFRHPVGVMMPPETGWMERSVDRLTD
eukprot:s931_g4.t4